jgi:hypothetical protein
MVVGLTLGTLGFPWLPHQYQSDILDLNVRLSDSSVEQTGSTWAMPAIIGGGICLVTLAVSGLIINGRSNLFRGSATKRRARASVKAPSRPDYEDFVQGPREWASVSCPDCGNKKLDFVDSIHRWRCARCDRTFS